MLWSANFFWEWETSPTVDLKDAAHFICKFLIMTKQFSPSKPQLKQFFLYRVPSSFLISQISACGKELIVIQGLLRINSDLIQISNCGRVKILF
eukprot:403351252